MKFLEKRQKDRKADLGLHGVWGKSFEGDSVLKLDYGDMLPAVKIY